MWEDDTKCDENVTTEICDWIQTHVIRFNKLKIIPRACSGVVREMNTKWIMNKNMVYLKALAIRGAHF